VAARQSGARALAVTLGVIMGVTEPVNSITVRIIERPDQDCWDMRAVVNGVVMHSRRVLTTDKLTRPDAKAIFDACQREIDSWLF
jgi:hypothetical protein